MRAIRGEVDDLIQQYLQKSVNIHRAAEHMTILNSGHQNPWMRPNLPMNFRFTENPTGSTAFITDAWGDITGGSTLQQIAQQFQNATGQSPTNMMVTTTGGVTIILFPVNGPGRWESVWVCNTHHSLMTIGTKINNHKRGKIEVNVRLDASIVHGPPLTREFTVRRDVEDFNSENKSTEAILEYRDKIISNVNFIFDRANENAHMHYNENQAKEVMEGFLGVCRIDMNWFPLLRTNKRGSLSNARQRRRGRSKNRMRRSRRKR